MPRPISDATAAEWALIAAGSLRSAKPRGFWDDVLAPNPGLVEGFLAYAPSPVRELLESVGSRMQRALGGGKEFEITQAEVESIAPLVEVIRMAASLPA